MYKSINVTDNLFKNDGYNSRLLPRAAKGNIINIYTLTFDSFFRQFLPKLINKISTQGCHLRCDQPQPVQRVLRAHGQKQERAVVVVGRRVALLRFKVQLGAPQSLRRRKKCRREGSKRDSLV
jgi:hypothetical protein